MLQSMESQSDTTEQLNNNREREGVPLKKEKDWDGLSGDDIILELSELWHREWEVGDVSISQLVDIRTYCSDGHHQSACHRERSSSEIAAATE